MKPSIDKLQKFLKLEADRGFDNRAVVGGLDQMLERWQADAYADSLPSDLINFIVDRLRSYASLNPISRSEMLTGIWARIERETGETLTPLPPPPTEDDSPPVQEPKPSGGKRVPEKPKAIPTNESTNLPIKPAPKNHQPKPAGPAMAGDNQPAALNAPVTVLQGVGPRHAQTLSKLGLSTLGDMLYYFPRRYLDYSELKPINRLTYGEEVTIIGVIDSTSSRTIRNGKLKIIEAVISDPSGALRATWFNQPWLLKRLRKGNFVALSGKTDQYLGRLVMNNPELEQLDREQINTNRIVPVYPLTANITQRWLRGMMHQVVSYWASRLQEFLPADTVAQADLVDLTAAIQQIHFPDSWDTLKTARYRLAFDEIFLLQLGVLQQKRDWQERSARKFAADPHFLNQFTDHLPYRPTEAQNRAIQEVCTDLDSGRPMNRLLQGDVGSGKTLIAAVAMAVLANHGVQSAMMAPTSILAEQHYQNLVTMLCNHHEPTIENQVQMPPSVLDPDEICLLLGSTPDAEKRVIRAGLESGRIKIVVGTHALIEDPIVFSDLQLAVIDEQHRFGVQQRAKLRQKSDNPHLLVMTATPIPRSLALTVYGDLDLSVLDEMPPGRQPVETHIFLPTERERVYSLIRNQVAAGKQAFIIYPLVEETDKSESKAAVDEHKRLQSEVFPDLNLGVMHGRLHPEEKEDVMAQFRDRAIDVLVSTSVVEVGVDVPNATVMVIEGANRFGLAQLHQFRGRVGRGQDKAYCLLIPETSDAFENERLVSMSETNNGFILAERDLEQRGPGSFLGTRQSGYQAELQLADITDLDLIENARRQANLVITADPDLVHPENQQLSLALSRFWGEGRGDIS